jgi:hypothetical protein
MILYNALVKLTLIQVENEDNKLEVTFYGIPF